MQDECSKDENCGGHGRCWDIGATSYPRKQCYCEAGYFGPGCSKRSHSKAKKLQEGLYTRRDLSEKLTLYWRILKEAKEVEMVLRLNGTSWAAVGWRPKGLTASCKKFPVLADQEPVARSIDFGESVDLPRSQAQAQVQPREGRAKKVEKRMTTSIDVGISYVTSSVSSSRSKRAAETKEEVKRRIRQSLLNRRRFQRAFGVPPNPEAGEVDRQRFKRPFAAPLSEQGRRPARQAVLQGQFQHSSKIECHECKGLELGRKYLGAVSHFWLSEFRDTKS